MSASQYTPRDSVWLRLRRWLARMLAPSSEQATQLDPDEEEFRAHDSEDLERANVLLARKLHEDFERNLREPVRVTGLRLTGVDFFADTSWELHPSVNVLLGRNGFGKSLLLRTLAGMLQRDAEVTGDLFRGADSSARLELDLTRSGRAEKLERDAEVFLRESVGKVPLLAIPDSRFTDRSTTTVSEPGTLNLATDGAVHFLNQLPYQSAVEALLGGLAFDYWEHGRTFDLPGFALLERIVRELSDQAFEFRAIDRVGRTGSCIWVRTEGLDRDLEIQHASQGTLSAITLFGSVHAFLQEIAATRQRGRSSKVREQEAIVLIDEVDAHLHPVWQQKIRNLLIDVFPNVQFVLSAHSPLVVAGCGPGEVSVLRKSGDRFVVEQLEKDFVGVSTQDLYRDIFDIEDLDEVFLEYVNKEASGERGTIDRKINDLLAKEEKGNLSPRDDLTLKQLLLDNSRLARVTEVQEQRRDAEQQMLQQDAEIRRLRAALERLQHDPASEVRS